MPRTPKRAPRNAGVIVAREIHLVDALGRLRAHFRVDPNDQPSIQLVDTEGSTRLDLSLSDDGEASVGFFGPKARPILGLRLTNDCWLNLQCLDRGLSWRLDDIGRRRTGKKRRRRGR